MITDCRQNLQQKDKYSLTLSTKFPSENKESQKLQQIHVLQSASLEEHLNILKRVHLTDAHLPEIKLIGDFHTKLQISLSVYPHTILQRIGAYSHQQKIDLCIQLLATYKLLIQEYGYFLITHDHIRSNNSNHVVLWIHPIFINNQPSLPIEPHSDQEHQIVAAFIQAIRQFFSTDCFKHRQITSIQQLSSYLLFIKKRNKIHKNCSSKAKEMSQSKIRSNLSISARLLQTPLKKYDKYKPLSSYSSLLTSKIMGGGRQPMRLNTSTHFATSGKLIMKKSRQSRMMRSQMDTNYGSSELNGCNKISYLQLGNFFIKSPQKKSCVFGYNPQAAQENKKTLLLSRSGCEKADKSQIELQCNQLLSQIKEDTQIEVGAEVKKPNINEIMLQFQTLLCS